MLMCIHTMVEVELCYGQQDSGKCQVWAEPTEERLDARECSVDKWGILYAHTIQDTHRLHQALGEETGQTQHLVYNGAWNYRKKRVCYILFPTS